MNERIVISKMIEDNLAEYQVAMGTSLPDATVVDEGAALWVVSKTPFYMYNGVFRSAFDPANVGLQVQRLKQEFEQRNVPMVWMLGPSSTPTDLAGHLVKHGFQHYEDEPGMCLELQHMNENFAYPEGFEIHLVQSEQALLDWISVWSYDAPKIVPQLLEIHRQFGYHSAAPWRYYLGVQNGEPVATCLLFFGQTSAAVHWVVTIPEARKQGIGAVMTVAALRDARVAGYRHAILTASPFGERIYTRIGFKPYCTISKYVWKP